METFAERKLEILDGDGSRRELLVIVGKPLLSEEGGPWKCPYQIMGAWGPGTVEEKAAYGEDSMQALILGLQQLGEVLDYINRTRGPLTWLGQPDLGIPRT